MIEKSLREVRRVSHETNNAACVAVIHHRQKFGFRLPLFTALSNVFLQSFTFFFWKKKPMLKPDLFCKKCSHRCVTNAAAKTNHQIQLNKINLWTKALLPLTLFFLLCWLLFTAWLQAQEGCFFCFLTTIFSTLCSHLRAVLCHFSRPCYSMRLHLEKWANWTTCKGFKSTKCTKAKKKKKRFLKFHLHQLPWRHRGDANGLQLLFLRDGFSKMVFDYYVCSNSCTASWLYHIFLKQSIYYYYVILICILIYYLLTKKIHFIFSIGNKTTIIMVSTGACRQLNVVGESTAIGPSL